MMKPHKYIRDGRAPIPIDDFTSQIMSKIRSKNTKPEIHLRKALFHSGHSGYRLHWKKAPGRPDICYPGRKIAIFVHGCFWHRCPVCNPPTPKSHLAFWADKFQKNQQRDQEKKNCLESLGWTVLVIWECEIKQDVKACADRVQQIIIEKDQKTFGGNVESN